MRGQSRHARLKGRRPRGFAGSPAASLVGVLCLLAACDSDPKPAAPADPLALMQHGPARPVTTAALPADAEPGDAESRLAAAIRFSHAAVADAPALRDAAATLHFAGGDVSTSNMLQIVATSLDRNLIIADPLKEDTKISVRPAVRVDDAVEMMRKVLASQGRQLTFSRHSILVKRMGSAAQGVSDAADVVHAIRLNFVSNKTFIDLASAFISRDRLIAPSDDPSLVIFVGPAESTDTIDRIAKLIDLFDLKNTRAEIVRLQRGDPTEVARHVRDAIGGGPGGFPKIIPVASINAIMVVGPANFDATDIRLLIDRLDHVTPQDDDPVLAYRPNHRSAQEIYKVLKALVHGGPDASAAQRPGPKKPDGALGNGPDSGNEPNSSITSPLDQVKGEVASDVLGRANRPAGAPTPPPVQSNSGLQTASLTGEPDNDQQTVEASVQDLLPGGAAAARTGTAGMGLPKPTDPLADAGGSATSQLQQVVGATTVDPETNRILFAGTSAQYKVLQKILSRIDDAGAEIQVEAVVLQVDLTDELQFGVQYSLTNAKVFNSLLSGTVSSTGTIQSVLPGMIFDFAGRDASVLVNALDSVTHVTVVSSPKVLVKSGEPAKVHFGQSVPMLQEQLTTPLALVGSSVTNQIVYRDTGITLNVTPTKLNDDLIELAVDEDISDIANQTVTSIDSPVFDDRSIKTKVKIKFGQTVLLGGLIQQQQNDTNSGIPILSRIPLVGNLFGQKDRSGARSEFVLLLTPRMFADGTAPTIGDTMTLRFDKAIELWSQATSGTEFPASRDRFFGDLEGP